MAINNYLRLRIQDSSKRSRAQTRRHPKIAATTVTLACFFCLAGCGHVNQVDRGQTLTPGIVTERVRNDSDDPAIWVHPGDPSKSLIIGTDKHEDGALYVFGLDGRIIAQKTVTGLKRPNNVDVEYGLMLKGVPTDVAVTTERYTSKIRAYSLPDMIEIDNGGIPVFAGEAQRDPMGIALYKRPADAAIFAIVGRKSGPTSGGYLWQYRLEDDGLGKVKATKVREFGTWSGRKEIEAIAVDDPLGYVYYSDEGFGIRKYRADPDAPDANVELAVFGTTGFAEDQEGICVYQTTDTTGYILVSDQSANRFHIFTREGEPGQPHSHRLLKTIRVTANQCDGAEVASVPLTEKFPAGLLVAMSDDGTFHFYSWKDIADGNLVVSRKE
jgi:3-phytase